MERFDDDVPDTEREPLTTARLELESLLEDLGVDETRVLTRIAHRLREGAETYGVLEVALDRRDFRSREAREELEDALVYLACAWLKAEGGNS